MISVLCPTRNRPDRLVESLNSLMATATGGPHEYLVAIDPDDSATAEVGLPVAHDGSTTSIWVAPERYGYRQLHLYYDELARQASGEWLLLWNDDAVMQSHGWDTYISSHDEAVVETIKGICFPAVPKRWVDHLGHFALEWHNDAWWEQIGILLGRRVKASLKGTHDNPDDQTSDEARGQKRNPDFYGPANMALIRADVEKIKEIL